MPPPTLAASTATIIAQTEDLLASGRNSAPCGSSEARSTKHCTSVSSSRRCPGLRRVYVGLHGQAKPCTGSDVRAIVKGSRSHRAVRAFAKGPLPKGLCQRAFAKGNSKWTRTQVVESYLRDKAGTETCSYKRFREIGTPSARTSELFVKRGKPSGTSWYGSARERSGTPAT